MTGGALSGLTDLVRSKQTTDQQAYDMATSGYEDAAAVLRRPRTGHNPALALAAGFLAPTRSGSFGESLGRAVSGYADATKSNEDAELDRETKLAAIKQAQARLLSGLGDNRFATGLKMFELPGMAVKYGESLEDLEDLEGGGSGIPAMPGSGGTGGVPAMPKAPATPPSPAPTSGGPLPAPNANVGSLQDVAAQSQMAAGEALPPMPGQGQDTLAGGAGQDTLAFAGNEPPTPAEAPQAQPPQQTAQAAPAAPQGAPAAPQPPSQEQQLYNWALQVRQAAAANPSQWSRRPKYKFALEQANKVIDDYRASQNAQATQVFRQNTLDARQAAIEAREAAMAAKDPYRQTMQKAEADTIAKSREEADRAGRSIEDLRVIEELRKRPVATGPAGQYLTKFLDVVGMGGGQALEGRGVDLWVRAVEPLKGALSNTEGNRFDRANAASLSMNDPEANILIALGKGAAQRLQQKNAFLETYRRNNGTLEGAEQQWSRFVQERPMIHVDKEGKETILTQNVDAWGPFAARSPALARGATDSAPGRQIPQVQSVDDYNALKPGDQYLDPQGNLRTKK